MHKLIWLFYVFNVICYVNSVKQGLNIGKFDLRLNRIDMCKGPKSKDCGTLMVTVYNHTTLSYVADVKQKMKLAKAKVVAQTNGHDLVRLQIVKPCDHIIIKQVVETTFNISSNCAVAPGRYELAFNLDKIAQTYYGGSFMYGDYAFKTLFMSDDCNVSCLTVHVSFIPKNKN